MIKNVCPKLCFLLLLALPFSGCQINKHTSRQNEAPKSDVPNTETPQDETPEYIPGARRIDPASDLQENPTQIGKFKGSATRSMKNFYSFDDKKCQGFLEPKPALIFESPRTSGPYRITAHGEIDFLMIEFSDREIRCERRARTGEDPVIELRDTGGKPYKIYGGRFQKQDRLDYALSFENLGQPLNVNWLDADVPTLHIDTDLTPPKFLQINTTTNQNDRSPENGDDSCSATPGRFVYALVPEVRMEIQQTAEITLGVRSSSQSQTPIHMTLVGPVTQDRRDIPVRCLATNTETVQLDAGTYYIRVGFPQNAPRLLDTDTIQFFVHGAAAALDPLTRFDSVPQGLPVDGRVLSQHYPFLEAELLVTNDSVGQQLFTTVPPSLYVVATEDIIANQNTTLFHGKTQPDDTLLDDNRTPEFPKKDELLLLLNQQNVVLAADGSLFIIPQNFLKPAEQADVITLPTAARNTKTYFRNALLLADESDQGRLEQYNQRNNRYQHCVVKNQSDDHAPNSPYVTKTCGLNQFTAENKRLWRQLEDSRTARRNDALKIVRTRLADLVLVK